MQKRRKKTSRHLHIYHIDATKQKKLKPNVLSIDAKTLSLHLVSI